MQAYNIKNERIIDKCFNPFDVTCLLITPWKHNETSGFFLLSGGIERDQWHEMG